MKKIVKFLLMISVLLFAVSLSACGTSKSSEAGYYKLYSYKDGDTEYKEEQLKSRNMDGVYIVLEKDGKGVFFMFNSKTPIEWKDGKMTINGTNTVDFVVEGDILTIKQKDTLKFKRSNDAPPSDEKTGS